MIDDNTAHESRSSGYRPGETNPCECTSNQLPQWPLPPPEGEWKLNFDASAKGNSRNTGTRDLICDNWGRVLRGFLRTESYRKINEAKFPADRSALGLQAGFSL